MNRIILAAKNDRQNARAVLVERETESAWYATPVDNPACPVLLYPKFAWVKIADAPDLDDMPAFVSQMEDIFGAL